MNEQSELHARLKCNPVRGERNNRTEITSREPGHSSKLNGDWEKKRVAWERRSREGPFEYRSMLVFCRARRVTDEHTMGSWHTFRAGTIAAQIVIEAGPSPLRREARKKRSSGEGRGTKRVSISTLAPGRMYFRAFVATTTGNRFKPRLH